MNRYIKSILFIGLPLVVITYLMFLGHQWSVHHVNYINAGQPHPLNCVSCHVYPLREGLLPDLLNKKYLSPLNIAVSSDGNKIFVTAQDGDALIISDVNTGKLIKQIDVGEFPHSVVLSRDEKTAYVSNQWSNNISVIDLEKYKVVDTIMVGGGPAGMELDAEGRYLYIPNTYTSDLSIIDLENQNEIRRLTTGNRPMSVAISPDQNTVLVTSRRTLPVAFRTPPKTELTVANAKSKKVSERRYFNIDSIIFIKNRSTRPIKLLKVAFVGEKTGVIKEFVSEADTVEVAPLSLRCFTVNNETIPAEEYKRPHFQSSTGHEAEGVSFHVEWEADSRVAPPKITSELIKPLLPLFYEPILPDGGSCNCEVIDQW